MKMGQETLEWVEMQIDELERQIEYHMRGSYVYDVLDGELQYLYCRADRLREEAEEVA